MITLWYLLAIVLYVLRFTATCYPLVSYIYSYWLPYDIFRPFYCMSFALRLLITLWYLHTFGHCIICPSIYGYWLPFGILDLQLLITLWYLLAIVLSLLRFTATDYPLVSSHFWPLYYNSKDRQYNGQKIYIKGVISSCKSMDRQYNGQKIPKVISSRKSKDRQYNSQKISKGNQ
jgi:hypothetical protein